MALRGLLFSVGHICEGAAAAMIQNNNKYKRSLAHRQSTGHAAEPFTSYSTISVTRSRFVTDSGEARGETTRYRQQGEDAQKARGRQKIKEEKCPRASQPACHLNDTSPRLSIAQEIQNWLCEPVVSSGGIPVDGFLSPSCPLLSFPLIDTVSGLPRPLSSALPSALFFSMDRLLAVRRGPRISG